MSLTLMVYSPCTASPPLHCSQSLAITFWGIFELIVKERGRKEWWEGQKKWSFLSFSFPSLPACVLPSFPSYPSRVPPAGLQLSRFSLVPYFPLSLGKTCRVARPPSLKQRRLGWVVCNRRDAAFSRSFVSDIRRGREIKTVPGRGNLNDQRGCGFGRRLFQIFPS